MRKGGAGIRERHARPRHGALLAWLFCILVAGPALEASADCSKLGLPPLWVGDLDGDGRYTGRDIGLGLQACSDLGGCALTLLAETYEDVAIFVHGAGDAWDCTAERSVCSTDSFPAGLVIQGQGSGTVLRSPLWSPPYAPKPILEMRRRPEVRFQLRDLTLDGRKHEQLAPTPGSNDQQAWLHHGFQSWNQWGDHARRSRDGCIQGVTVRDLLSTGISLSDADGWTVQDSSVEDVGCQRGFSDCPQLGLPDVEGAPPGFQAAGYGIMIGWFVEDLLLQNNTLRRTTKYAMGLKHGQDGKETSIKRPRVIGNRMLDVGYLGLFVAGVEDGRFLDNTIDSTNVHGEPAVWAPSNNTFGVSCHGVVKNTTFSRNEILNSAGMSFNYQCSGFGNRIAHTRISGSCREKNPNHCNNAGNCYEQPDLRVTAAEGGLTLEGVSIDDTRCAAPFGAQQGSDVSLTVYDMSTQRNECDRLDINGDGAVGFPDPPAFEGGIAKCWADSSNPLCERLDVDGDGLVGLSDLGEFETRFQRCFGS